MFEGHALHEEPLSVRWLFVNMLALTGRGDEVVLPSPSRDLLAAFAGMSARQVNDALDTLENELHLVTPTDHGWRIEGRERFAFRALLSPRDRKATQRVRETAWLFNELGEEHEKSRVTNRVTPNVTPDVVEVPLNANTGTNHGVSQRDVNLIHSARDAHDAREAGEIAVELARAAKAWNRLAPTMRVRRVGAATVAKCVNAYSRIRSRLQQEEPGFTLDGAIERAVNQEFLHGKNFFTFAWFFGSKLGELNAGKVWRGSYNRSPIDAQRTSRGGTSNAGPDPDERGSRPVRRIRRLEGSTEKVDDAHDGRGDGEV